MDDIKFTDLAHFQEKQKEAWYTLLNPQCKYLLYGGAMGPGKSYALRWSAVGYLMYLYGKYGYRDIPVGLFSKDYPTLRDRQIAKISQEFPDWLGEIKETQQWGLAFHLAPQYGSGHVLLRNLDDPSKYKSTEFAAEFVEELTENDADKFKFLRTRLRYPNLDEVKFMGATNPGDVGHAYCRDLFVDRSTNDTEQDRFFYIHATVYDNKYASGEYIKQLESLPEKEKKMYLYGSWDVFEGQVFSEFDRNIHVCPAFIPKPSLTFVDGMDWGFTDPAVLECGVFVPVVWQDPETGDNIRFNRLYIYKELSGNSTTPQQWAKIYKEKIPNLEKHRIFGDPNMFNKLQDSAFGIAKQFSKEGINITKSTNDRKLSVQTIHNWLSLAPDGEPYMIITENCKMLIKTIPEAIYDEHEVEDIDKDWADDHWIAALRYLTAMIRWIDAKAGSYGYKGDMIMGVAKPKYQIVNTKGEFVSLDPERFATPNKKGVFYQK